MYKGTTPTLTLTFDESINLSEAEHIVVTFATDYHKVITEKADSELTVEDNKIEITFTQAETLAMEPGPMLVQVNLLYSDGNRSASNIGQVEWLYNLKNEVMQ